MKKYFRIFKTWLKKSISTMKVERAKKNKMLRIEEKIKKEKPNQNVRTVTKEDLQRITDNIKKPPLEKILRRKWNTPS